MKAIQLPVTLYAVVGIALASVATSSCSFSLENLVVDNALHSSIRSGTHYRHTIFSQNSDSNSGRLRVYIGGDGKPWVNGRRPSTDPTPDNPLALRLMTLDTTNAVFVGRPCFFGLAGDDECDSDVWTFARYSQNVMDSMLSVIRGIVADGDYEEVFIVGYSGGGVIARLIAADIPELMGLLTINANLDVDAWTRFHGYLPLTNSRNPAKAPPLPTRVMHVQAIGGKDTIVPPLITDAYQLNNQDLEVWHYPDFDHVCCWRREWPMILSRFEASLIAHERRKY